MARAHRLLADARYLHEKMSALQHVGAPGGMLETVVQEKSVEAAAAAAAAPVAAPVAAPSRLGSKMAAVVAGTGAGRDGPGSGPVGSGGERAAPTGSQGRGS